MPVSFTGTVVPPSPPPVNPAPPSGSAARKEARQRQAAAAKSEEGATDARGAGGDLADKPPSPDQGMTRRGGDVNGFRRRAADRHAPSITPLSHGRGSSAWARDALYGGGLAVTALVLALGSGVVRPKPRRRRPDVPAPAWGRRR
jgi:hypothetical protein